MSRDDDETPDKERKEREEERALDEQIAEYLKLGVPLATLVCAVVAGFARGAPAVVLVLAGGVLVTVIAILWASVRTLVGETPLSGADAYALGALPAAEEQKRAVLRALKDLEVERSVGKISEEDYQVLVARYRDEAKRLLRSIDEDAEPERARVETLVAIRLHREGLADDPGPPYRDAPKGAATAKKKAKKKDEPAPMRVVCAACGTKNDPDAVFCKKCGARQGAAIDEDDEDEPVKDDEEAAS